MNKIVLAAATVTLVTLAAIGLENSDPAGPDSSKATVEVTDLGAQAATTTATKVFNVEHMTCETCPITVRKAMSSVDGVKSVEVNLDAMNATVTYNPSETTPELIAAASTNVGFPATVSK